MKFGFLFLFITFFSFSQTKKNQEGEKMFKSTINDKTGLVNLSLNDLKDVVISSKDVLSKQNSKVISFKIRIPNNLSHKVQGNKLDSTSLKNLKDSKRGDIILITDVVNNINEETEISSFNIIDQKNDLELSGTIRGVSGVVKISKKGLFSSLIHVKSKTRPRRYEVIEYKIKINYDQIFTVKGYRVTNEVKEYLDYAKANSKVEIFDIIVNFNNQIYTNVEPIYVELKD